MIHIKYNKIDYAMFEYLKNKPDPFFCLKCQEEIIPFQKLSDQQFYMVSEKGINDDNDLSNLFIPTNSSLKTYFNDINNLNDNINNMDCESPSINCSYVDVSSFDHRNKKDTLSLFYLHIASLSKHKEELETLLNMIDLKFDIVGITQTKIYSYIDVSFDININGYKCYSTPTEAEKGGSILYIADPFNSKPLQTLNKMMYKPKQLESVFVEICNNINKNVIIGCIYRHPSMDLNEFNEEFINPLMEKLATDNKKLFLVGDFNIDLLKVDVDPPTTNFFDIITTNLLVPHIIHPTRITSETRI